MDEKHLPAIGIGPIAVVPQLVVTSVGIGLSVNGLFDDFVISFLKIPFYIIGTVFIAVGIYLWNAANYTDKVFDCIAVNKLLTTGVYAVVRNPIYSSFFLICTGTVFIANNPVLLVIPFVCWIYMTIILKVTEEKWLKALYGSEYDEYCKKVNRCIPWFPKKK